MTDPIKHKWTTDFFNSVFHLVSCSSKNEVSYFKLNKVVTDSNLKRLLRKTKQNKNNNNKTTKKNKQTNKQNKTKQNKKETLNKKRI